MLFRSIFHSFRFLIQVTSFRTGKDLTTHDFYTTSIIGFIPSCNAKSAVVGISGGLDSTLALLVCVKTFDKLGWSRKDIIGVTMPGFGTTDRTYTNALDLMNSLGITVREVSIKEACIQHFKDIDHDIDVHDVVYENEIGRAHV